MIDHKQKIAVLIADTLNDVMLKDAIEGLRTGYSVHVVASPKNLELAPIERKGIHYWGAIDSGQVNWCLTMIGAPSRLEIFGSQIDATEIVDRSLLHLVDGAQLVVHKGALASQQAFDDFTVWALRLRMQGLDSLADFGLTERHKRLRNSLKGLESSTESVIFQKQGSHVLKIRDAEATRVLLSRSNGRGLKELLVKKDYRWTPTNTVKSYPASPNLPQPDAEISVPKRYLRAYSGDVRMVERCLTLQGNVALPQSFRFHLEQTLSNPRLENLDKDFGVIKNDLNYSWDYLPGVYYDLDSSNSGHFGHLTTEVLSRFWGWDEAKKQYPDLKALFRIRTPGERDPKLERTLFEAYGIAEQDIVWSPVPVQVDTLVAATPMWHNQFPHYADLEIRETWARMRDHLVDPEGPKYDRLFVSRRPSFANRQCHNTPELEQLFKAEGFTVIYPEDYSLAEQASIFANARVVAGFGGSALFNVMFASKLESLIVLNHQAYTARNEFMYGAVLGVDVTYFWSKPEKSHPIGGWSEAAYFSNWKFDFAALGSTLKKLLRNS